MENTIPTLPGLRIVVVEDDPTICQFLKETITSLGHQVVGDANNGADMVRTVLALEPDVVVFDIHLPYERPRRGSDRFIKNA